MCVKKMLKRVTVKVWKLWVKFLFQMADKSFKVLQAGNKSWMNDDEQHKSE